MQFTQVGRRLSRLLTLATVCFGMTANVGCGGAEEETVVPEQPPSEKAKDSMDYYRNNVLQE